MKIAAFIETRQADLIRKILEHCGFWHDPPSRSPPSATGRSQTPLQVRAPDPESGVTYEADPESRWNRDTSAAKTLSSQTCPGTPESAAHQDQLDS